MSSIPAAQSDETSKFSEASSDEILRQIEQGILDEETDSFNENQADFSEEEFSQTDPFTTKEQLESEKTSEVKKEQDGGKFHSKNSLESRQRLQEAKRQIQKHKAEIKSRLKLKIQARSLKEESLKEQADSTSNDFRANKSNCIKRQETDDLGGQYLQYPFRDRQSYPQSTSDIIKRRIQEKIKRSDNLMVSNNHYKRQKYEKSDDSEELTKTGRLKRKQMTSNDLEALRRQFQDMVYGGMKITLKELGLKYGCISRTIRKYFKAWKQDPSMKVIFDRHQRSNLNQFKTRFHGKHYIPMQPQGKTIARFKFIRKRLTEDPFLTQRELGNEMRNFENLPVTEDHSYIKRILETGGFVKNKLNFITPERNSQKNLLARRKFCERYNEYLKSHEIYFILIQEYIFYPYMYRDYFWVCQGMSADLRKMQYSKSCVGVLAIIGSNGHFRYEIKDETYSSQDQAENEVNQIKYVKAISSLMNSIPSDETPKVIIAGTELDPDEEKKRLSILDVVCLNRRYVLDQTPICSHQLHPIESLFNDVKESMKKMNNDTTETIVSNVQEKINLVVNQARIKKCFTDLDFYIKRGLEGENF